ncbi:hypothetical protein AAC387_Pa07g1297 [Persea americana]
MANSSSSSSTKYPYPSSLNVENFVSIKLIQTNYRLWRTQVLRLLESQDMMGFIDGDIIAPPEMIIAPDDSVSTSQKEIINQEFLAWRHSDRLLRGWITGTLNEDTLTIVVGLDTTKDVWTALNDSFAQHSIEREFHLEQRLYVKHSKWYTLTL